MITQREILTRLNRLVVGYAVSWDDIKYDADKAIDKINSFMGTVYPPMSKFLTHAEATYSVRAGGVDYAIFPDVYILTIVIPYIAMEILARDEEFTTVFNKYATEVEENLFTMFQREYNRVPRAFLQNGDVGVLFPKTNKTETSKTYYGHNVPGKKPTVVKPTGQYQSFQFRINYHLNNPEVASIVRAPIDTFAYDYEGKVTVLDFNTQVFSNDGVYVYEFIGWMLESINGKHIEPGTEFEIISDVNLYARWNKFSTLTNSMGTVTIKPEYAAQLTQLILPTHLQGGLITTIPSNFTAVAVNLQKVYLPQSIKLISSYAFSGYLGTDIIFQETGENITIRFSAFRDLENVRHIIIPKRVNEIKRNAFEGDGLTIHVRYLQHNIPEGWETFWANPIHSTIEWGYNG